MMMLGSRIISLPRGFLYAPPNWVLNLAEPLYQIGWPSLHDQARTALGRAIYEQI